MDKKNTYHVKSKHIKDEMAVIISDKIDLKNTTKNNEEHFIIIKGPILQKGSSHHKYACV